MRHVIVNQHEDIPTGYDTYSILLVPDEKWFGEAGIETGFRLFSQFKRFGDMIGDKHLACWFNRSFIGSYSKLTDLEFIAAIPADIVSARAVSDFIRTKCQLPEDHGSPSMQYDVARARLICTKLKISYNKGPYVAFYSKYPTLPYYEIDSDEFGSHGTVVCNEEHHVSPACVLKFGGVRFDRALNLLDLLEQDLIRSNPGILKLQYEQLMFRIREFFHAHGETVVEVIKAGAKLCQ